FDATPAFIDSINADTDVDLVMHVGDIHSGKQYCTAEYDLAIFNLWTAFHSPLVYTPGDNEWSDCHKKAEGGGLYDSTTDPPRSTTSATRTAISSITRAEIPSRTSSSFD